MSDDGAIFRWWNRRALVVSAVLMIILFYIDNPDFSTYKGGVIGGLFLYLLLTFGGMLVVSGVVNWVVAGTIVMDENWLLAHGMSEQTEGERLMKLYNATGSIEEDE